MNRSFRTSSLQVGRGICAIKFSSLCRHHRSFECCPECSVSMAPLPAHCVGPKVSLTSKMVLLAHERGCKALLVSRTPSPAHGGGHGVPSVSRKTLLAHGKVESAVWFQAFYFAVSGFHVLAEIIYVLKGRFVEMSILLQADYKPVILWHDSQTYYTTRHSRLSSSLLRMRDF